jgi:hypothetical protein
MKIQDCLGLKKQNKVILDISHQTLESFNFPFLSFILPTQSHTPKRRISVSLPSGASHLLKLSRNASSLLHRKLILASVETHLIFSSSGSKSVFFFYESYMNLCSSFE